MVDKRSLSGAFLSLLLAFTLLLAFCSATPVHAVASWNVQTMDSRAAGYGNGYSPITVDQGGNPHIAYTGYDIQDDSFLVRYARWNSSLGGLSTQRIASGYATDVALGPHNNPVILCGSGGLQYVSWNGTGWTFQKVDNGNYGVLALGSNGNPHVAYINGITVKYASRSGLTWTIETVDTVPEIPFRMSLALDSNDTPHILYSNPTVYEDKSTGTSYGSTNVTLATLENSGWNIQHIQEHLPQPIKELGNMALDSKGHPHLVYSVGGVNNATIKYASWNGFSWKTQTVVSGIPLDIPFGIPFIALDSLDYPHLGYVSGFKLMYAGWTGLEWDIQTVDPGPSIRGPVYLAVDSNRIPHISYRVGSIEVFNYLMYATAKEPVPLYSPLPLQLVVTAVAIGAAVFVVYLWKKKT